MKFLLIALFALIPTAGICFFILRFGIFYENDILYKIVGTLSYCVVFFILEVL